MRALLFCTFAQALLLLLQLLVHLGSPDAALPFRFVGFLIFAAGCAWAFSETQLEVTGEEVRVWRQLGSFRHGAAMLERGGSVSGKALKGSYGYSVEIRGTDGPWHEFRLLREQEARWFAARVSEALSAAVEREVCCPACGAPAGTVEEARRAGVRDCTWCRAGMVWAADALCLPPTGLPSLPPIEGAAGWVRLTHQEDVKTWTLASPAQWGSSLLFVPAILPCLAPFMVSCQFASPYLPVLVWLPMGVGAYFSWRVTLWFLKLFFGVRRISLSPSHCRYEVLLWGRVVERASVSLRELVEVHARAGNSGVELRLTTTTGSVILDWMLKAPHGIRFLRDFLAALAPRLRHLGRLIDEKGGAAEWAPDGSPEYGRIAEVSVHPKVGRRGAQEVSEEVSLAAAISSADHPFVGFGRYSTTRLDSRGGLIRGRETMWGRWWLVLIGVMFGIPLLLAGFEQEFGWVARGIFSVLGAFLLSLPFVAFFRIPAFELDRTRRELRLSYNGMRTVAARLPLDAVVACRIFRLDGVLWTATDGSSGMVSKLSLGLHLKGGDVLYLMSSTDHAALSTLADGFS